MVIGAFGLPKIGDALSVNVRKVIVFFVISVCFCGVSAKTGVVSLLIMLTINTPQNIHATAIPAPIASDGKWILLVDSNYFCCTCMSDKVSFDVCFVRFFFEHPDYSWSFLSIIQKKTW